MLAWQIWLIVAGVCMIIEIFTAGFFAFWFSIAAVVACLLNIFTDNIIVQTSVFLILSAILVLFTRKFANKMNKNDNAVTNSNRLINMEGIVKKEISKTNYGQVKVNGELWTAILDDNQTYNSIPIDTPIKVIRIDGVKLVVCPIEEKQKSQVSTK